MSTGAHKENYINATLPGNEQVSPQTDEKEKKLRTEVEEWGWSAQHNARHDAGKRQSPLALGTIEAQLKRVSEQVTHEAQERQEHT